MGREQESSLMAFNVLNLQSEINNSGLAHSGYFEVRITPPVLGSALVLSRGLSLRTDTVTMPGRTLMALDNYRDYGVTRNIPYTANHGEVGMSVICSDDMREKEMFDKWQDLIVGRYRVDDPAEADKYNVGYYKDYVSTVEIDRFRPDGMKTYSMKLIEAWPRTISGLPMDWGTVDALRLNVQFNFRYYIVEQSTNSDKHGGAGPSNSSNGIDPFDGVGKPRTDAFKGNDPFDGIGGPVNRQL